MKIEQEVYGKKGGTESFDAKETDYGHESKGNTDGNDAPGLKDSKGGLPANIRKMLGM